MRLYVHFLDFPVIDLHTTDHIREQSNHVIVAHRHISNNLLERHLFSSMILVFFDSIGEF